LRQICQSEWAELRQTVDVGEVDPKDDAIERWLVMEVRYDSDRRERRNVVIAAFDSEDECNRRLIELRSEGRGADLTHQHYPIGYTAAQQRRRATSMLRGFKKARVRKRRT
jgi:hypothetical protein